MPLSFVRRRGKIPAWVACGDWMSARWRTTHYSGRIFVRGPFKATRIIGIFPVWERAQRGPTEQGC